MRGYECHFEYMKVDGQLTNAGQRACWSNLRYAINGTKDPFTQDELDKTYDRFVFVDKYTYKETEEHIKRLVRTLNKITPCEIVKIGRKEYIKIKVLKTYDQSLIVFNFLRNLWMGDEGGVNKTYTDTFFKTLKISRKYKDPLKRLTYANKVACGKFKATDLGHSNIHPAEGLKIKSTEQLLAYKGESTTTFLTR